MRLTKFPKKEPSIKAWAFRLLLGPASLLDGIVETLTFGFYGVGARLEVSKMLAMARIESKR